MKFEYQNTRFGIMNDIYILEQQYNDELGVSFLEGGYLEKESFKLTFSKLIFNNIFFDFDLLRLNSITTNQASIIPGNNNNGFPLTITDKYYDFRIKLRYNISK